MPRIEGWEHRLAELIASADQRDFQYGTWDCALFARAAIEACTGQQFSGEFAGYAGERECAKILAHGGGLRAIAERIAAVRGFAAVHPLMARRGDVVLGVHEGRDTLGVCVGATVAFATAPRGLVRVPITDPSLSVAWRIA